MRRIVVTGANGAIGKAIATALVEGGVGVVATCRTPEKCDRLRAELLSLYPEADMRTVVLDLGSSESVRAAAREMASLGVFALINNAGVMNRSYSAGEGGIEKTLLVNYHHTRLLSELLLPSLPAGGALVFTTSLTRRAGRSGSLPENVDEAAFSQLGTYALSKKLITRYARELSLRQPGGVRVNCADPGVVDSGMITMHRWFDPLANMLFRPFIRRPATGALAALRAVASPETGCIFTPRGMTRMR